jgi:dolichol-phosphate mannosyltransferase
MSEFLSLSICVPAFNEDKSLKQAVEDLLHTLLPLVQKLELIIVDDGSTDSTFQLSEQIAKEYFQVKVIHHKRNLGIGVCYRDALAVAGGEYFTWFPGDHENSAEEFIQCLPYLRKDSIVVCHHRGQDPRSVIRRKISCGYTWFLNRCFHLDLKYYNGLAIFPTSALRSLPLVANGFIFFAESLIKAIRSGYQVVELSAVLRRRNWGKSKSFSFFTMRQIISDIQHIF